MKEGHFLYRSIISLTGAIRITIYQKHHFEKKMKQKGSYITYQNIVYPWNRQLNWIYPWNG